MTRLKLLFAGILVVMLAVTTWASLDRSVFQAGNLLDDPWGVATLVDAYMGFLTFYVWVAYKETGLGRRLVWFVLIMGLGNIAMAAYVLVQLFGLPAGATVETLLLRKGVRP
ncbi:MAG: DUF1475 family protein [Vicinamibacteria bacterium]